MAFLDARADAAPPEYGELDHFGRWATINQLPAEWFLPRLAQATRSNTFDHRGLHLPPVADNARRDPASALEILRHLYDRSSGPTLMNYALLDHAPAILAAALDSADPELASDATALAETIGRDGYYELGAAIERHRQQEP